MARTRPLGFDWLIYPLRREEFLSQYWEREPALIHRRNKDYYKRLLTVANLDALIPSLNLIYPDCRLVKDGAAVPLNEYTFTSRGSDVRRLDLDRVYEHYYSGTSIILNALQKHWKPLAILCSRIEKDLNHPVQANIYLTPPRSRGFAPHYDSHDVFIMPVGGVKRWVIYGCEKPLALDSRTYSDDDQLPEKMHELELKPGDLIYIPRGQAHKSASSNELTAHITLGITTYTWRDVFETGMRQLFNEHAEFRRSLPLSFLNHDAPRAALESHFQELMATFNQRTELSRVLDKIRDRLVGTGAAFLDGQISELAGLHELTLSTVLQQRETGFSSVSLASDRVCLCYGGKRVTFPSHVESCLRFIQRTKKFSIQEIPGELDDESKLVLVRRLIREGFLRVSG